MKGIIFVPAVEQTRWVEELLPGITPAELPIAGKRYIDYALEYASNNGYEMAEILDWRYSDKLAADFSDLTGFPFPIFYQKGNGDLPKSPEDLKGQSTPLTQDLEDDITVVWGLRLGDFEIKNVADWHKINMDILSAASAGDTSYTLPGYSAEGGVFLGRNVVMENGFEAKKPVLVQDDVWCSRNVRLDGHCIIGKGSVIDEGAHLERTVVGDDTYIGIGLDLVDKLVMGHRIIDAKTGVWTDVEEPGVARGIGKGPGIWRRILNFLRGETDWRMS